MSGSDIETTDLEVLDLACPSTPSGDSAPVQGWSARSVLLLVVVSTLLLAAAGVVYGVRVHDRHVTRVVRAGSVSGVDAGGCPIEARCVPDAAPSTAVQRVALRLFPDAELIAADASGELGLVGAYRDTVVFTVSGAVITVVAGCVPGGRPVADRSGPSAPGRRAAGSVTLVAPGPTAGCSAAVVAEVPAGGTMLMSALQALVRSDDLYA